MLFALLFPQQMLCDQEEIVVSRVLECILTLISLKVWLSYSIWIFGVHKLARALKMTSNM